MDNASDNKKGMLYLMPVDLGSEKPEDVIPMLNLKVMQTIDAFIVENVRSARRFLRKAGYHKNFDEVTFHVLDKHVDIAQIPRMLDDVLAGRNVGLLSEAGNPCIADPGNKIVMLAHEKGIRVVPLVGPASILMALISSGFNGQQFCFHGYLPIEKKMRIQTLKELEQKAIQKQQTQIFMETPYRNNALLSDLLQHCQPATLLAIATNITCPDEEIKTQSIDQWKKKTPDLHKKPSVFLIGS